ncbi:MAG TPA: hypothetical protein VES67_11810 [Vicinamibacterales bacterium]|nr:hypothetical protein [Vicinamibacterales bacterium]
MVGMVGGAAFSLWSIVTMLWPVSYSAWDIGRSVLYVAFLLALTGLAGSVARSRQSVVRTFSSVAWNSVLAAALTLATYAMTTRFFAHRIIQLPEYSLDYAYHGYTSPEVYLATNYADLLQLQVFSWTVSVVGQVVVAGTAGWYLRRVRWLNKGVARAER